MASLLEISKLKDGMILSDCIAYLASYKKLPKKDGKSFYIAGNFTKQEESGSFKVWDSALVEALSQNDITGNVVKISGTVGTYMNNIDIKITAVEPINDPQYPKSMFMKSADVEGLFKEFTDFVNSELSTNAVKLLLGIFKTENLFGRFKEEFAGSKMHDAQIGGLMNHTIKMLRLAKCVYSNEPRMEKVEHFKDLLYLSVILHDIGKVYEMNLGVYQENSFVTHRLLGIEILVKYKKPIIDLFNDKFYYELISVSQGHHGKEFGDAPTTIIAFIVHLIDMVDSQTTGIFDRIERNDVSTVGSNNSVYVDGSYLVI